MVYTNICVDCLVKMFKITVTVNLLYFFLALFAGFRGSLTKIQYPKPRYGPFSSSLISSLLLKELTYNFYFIGDLRNKTKKERKNILCFKLKL